MFCQRGDDGLQEWMSWWITLKYCNSRWDAIATWKIWIFSRRLIGAAFLWCVDISRTYSSFSFSDWAHLNALFSLAISSGSDSSFPSMHVIADVNKYSKTIPVVIWEGAQVIYGWKKESKRLYYSSALEVELLVHPLLWFQANWTKLIKS